MSRPPKHASFDAIQRTATVEGWGPREYWAAAWDAAMRHSMSNEPRQPDRRIPRECGCISGHCTQEPSWSAGVRCKARMQEGAELMEVNHV